MRVINGNDFSLLLGQLAELEVNQLRGIDLIEPVASGNIAGLVKPHRHAVATRDDPAALPRSLPHRLVDNRRAHGTWESKLPRCQCRRFARLQTLVPPAMAGMMPTSSPAESRVSTPSPSRIF